MFNFDCSGADIMLDYTDSSLSLSTLKPHNDSPAATEEMCGQFPHNRWTLTGAPRSLCGLFQIMLNGRNIKTQYNSHTMFMAYRASWSDRFNGVHVHIRGDQTFS